MEDDRFITKPMSVFLDAIRALAALVVLIGHGVQAELYTGPYPFTRLFQHNAVVVFFVLSGLVIASSRSTQGTWRDYAAARAARILPVAIPALTFSVAAFLWGQWTGAPVMNPSSYEQLTFESLLLPFLFLSEASYGSGPVWNPPYWSLCYEVWFYALFGAAAFLRGRVRVLGLMLIAALAGPKVLLMLPVWLAGAWLARSSVARRATPAMGFLLVALGAAWLPLITDLARPAADRLLILTGLPREAFGFSVTFATDYVLALLVVLCFIGLRPLASLGAPALAMIERPIRYLASFSFTLYMLHWPMLCILHSLGVTAGSNLAGFAALLLGLIAVSAAVAAVTERKQHVVRRLLETALATTPRRSIHASRATV